MTLKPCPYCSEPILLTAKKCKHCGEWITKTRLIKKNSIFIFVLVLAILGSLVGISFAYTRNQDNIQSVQPTIFPIVKNEPHIEEYQKCISEADNKYTDLMSNLNIEKKQEMDGSNKSAEHQQLANKVAEYQRKLDEIIAVYSPDGTMGKAIANAGDVSNLPTGFSPSLALNNYNSLLEGKKKNIDKAENNLTTAKTELRLYEQDFLQGLEDYIEKQSNQYAQDKTLEYEKCESLYGVK